MPSKKQALKEVLDIIQKLVSILVGLIAISGWFLTLKPTILKFSDNLPLFDISIEVQEEGASAWSKAILLTEVGTRINFRIQFINTKQETVNNVLIRSILPKSLTYVENSTRVYVSNNVNGVMVSDKIVSETGINIGSFTAGSNAWIYFSADISTDITNERGNHILRSIIQVNYGYGTVEDFADVCYTVE